MTRFLTSVAALIGLAALSASGAELHVPAGFGTIQAAVDVAVDGDHVVVAPGTYDESVNLLGRKITLRSSAGAGATILDGALQPSSIITAISGESLDTVVQGFTFRNGIGRFVGACRLGGFLGGAIFVKDGGISVIDSTFENNGKPRSDEAGFSITGGGAIFACDADLVVSGSTFRGNNASFGGAIRFAAVVQQATISNSTFVGNRSAHGGAIQTDQALESSLTLTGSRFDANEAVHGGGVRITARQRATVRISGCSFRNGVAAFGGGVNMTADERTTIELTDTDFVGHEAGFGGGLFTIASGRLPAVQGGRISVTNCRFLGNVAHLCCDTGIYVDSCFTDGRLPQGNGQFYGGGADVRTINGGVVTLTNCLFAGNSGTSGGGVHASSCEGGVIDFVNNTIVDNDPSGLHLRLSIPDEPLSPGVGEIHVANSIIRGNSGSTQIPIEILAAGPTATVTFSNVEGGLDGTGNIDLPVTFVDSTRCDYRLAAGSAGIDAGDNHALDDAVTTDVNGRPRFVDDPDTIDTGAGQTPVVDIGAHERQTNVSQPGRRRAVRHVSSRPCPGEK